MKLSDALILKLDKITARTAELNTLLTDAGVRGNQNEIRDFGKELSELTPIKDLYDVYKAHFSQLESCEKEYEVESDAEMKQLLNDEIYSLKDAIDADAGAVKIALLPKDPNEDNNVIVEIRGGAGGEEAALFATELMKMYYHYADRNRWKVEEININSTELGGAKEAVFMISGKGAYGKLKFESGVHRVQRVPETESQGRIHTSTVTVAVLPEVQDVQIDIKAEDVKVDTYRSSGAGGQHVNKTESAIRMTHLPTGIVVECQDERSQIKNREKAMRVLKSRVYDYYQTQAEAKYAENRKEQVGTGDRSERIRTYNFPQGRVTDHRIGFTLYSLEKFMLGDLDEMIEALQLALQNKLLEGIE